MVGMLFAFFIIQSLQAVAAAALYAARKQKFDKIRYYIEWYVQYLKAFHIEDWIQKQGGWVGILPIPKYHINR